MVFYKYYGNIYQFNSLLTFMHAGHFVVTIKQQSSSKNLSVCLLMSWSDDMLSCSRCHPLMMKRLKKEFNGYQIVFLVRGWSLGMRLGTVGSFQSGQASSGQGRLTNQWMRMGFKVTAIWEHVIRSIYSTLLSFSQALH